MSVLKPILVHLLPSFFWLLMVGMASLPVLFPEGHELHSRALSTSAAVIAGGVLYSSGYWWARQVIAQFEAEGLDWDRDRRFVMYCFVPMPVYVVGSYFYFWFIKNPGEWDVVFGEFSWTWALVSFVTPLVSVPISAAAAMTRIHLDRGEHPFLSERPAPARWVVRTIVCLIVFPYIGWVLYRFFAGPIE